LEEIALTAGGTDHPQSGWLGFFRLRREKAKGEGKFG